MTAALRRLRDAVTTVALNITVLLAMIGAAAVIMMLANSGIGERWFDSDSRAALPNYRGVPWAAQHFYEWGLRGLQYYPYLGWRRTAFAGQTVTILPEYGERRTAAPAIASGKVAYFFGGSTMWGTGADDASTIPSFMARDTGITARNFGETGWTAHQSLEMLIRLIEEGHRPDRVVFYDGVNDVEMKCRSDSTADSVANESRLRERLELEPGSAAYDLYPFIDALRRFVARRRPAEVRAARCDTDPEKAHRVAAALVDDWRLAQTIAQAHGIRFTAILQPVAYFSRTRTDHIAHRLEDGERRQFAAVYPLVEEMIKGTGFHVLVTALDADEYFYVDFCHLSPNGNQRVARAIAPLIE